MADPHPSDSRAQRVAEPLIIAAVARRLGVMLGYARIDMGDGAHVELDGASADRTVLVEAYAHVGALRGAQGKKLATDAFKLAWAGRRLTAKRLVIAVIDVDAEAYLLRSGAWLTTALRDSGVEVMRVSIDSTSHGTMRRNRRGGTRDVLGIHARAQRSRQARPPYRAGSETLVRLEGLEL